MNHTYIRTVQLLLDVAPAVFDTDAFAMKGGTAINLFVQDMPRLSVDIDVVFVSHALGRDDALKTIAAELAAARHRVQTLGYEAELRKIQDGTEAKMFVRTPDAELYGSKLVAALDRQHPRDLFDVQLMLATHGWDEPLLDCFVVYLAGHNRPTHEVLFPKEKPLEAVFATEFEGMTLAPVALPELLATRQRMLTELPQALLPRHRDFLLSMLRAEPDWSLLPHAHLGQLPALQWKLQNLLRLKKNAAKFKMQHDELAARLHRGAEF